jgi:ring-1,2-phenylacetyl-CoA epoxidase subunit PaaC
VSALDPLLVYALRLGDDALIAGQRLAEWCGRAPMLEEELALANTALDFLGRARLCYGFAAGRPGAGFDEDGFAFRRDCREFTNHLIHELPCGDFAFTMARQFLVDAFGVLFLDALSRSAEPGLAAIGATCVKESRYHLRRSGEWMARLGEGTNESHERLQRAIDELWGYTPELFEQDALEQDLVAAGIAPELALLKGRWEEEVQSALSAVTVTIPPLDWQVGGGRRGLHTEHLGHLLSELQFMQRAYPGLSW